MQVEAINVTGSTLQQPPKAAESIDTGRKELAKGEVNLEKSNGADQNSVQSEEILTKIKALTQNGLYSVRFENNREFDQLVIKVVDTETEEVIRQIPAQEVLGMKATLAELSGKIVNTSR